MVSLAFLTRFGQYYNENEWWAAINFQRSYVSVCVGKVLKEEDEEKVVVKLRVKNKKKSINGKKNKTLQN